MDYSKLSDEELLALKSKDYSKLSDETLLALKGQNPPAALQKQKGPGFMDTVGEQVQKSLGPIGLAGKAQNVIQEGFDRLGNKVTDSLAQDGVQMALGSSPRPLPVDPRLAAAAGTFTQMMPSMVESVMPGEQALKGGQKLSKALKAPSKTKVLAQTIDDIKADIDKISLKQAEFPRTQVNAKIEALKARKEVGKAIQEFEAKHGIGFDQDFDVSPDFLKKAQKITKMTPKELAENLDLQSLQRINKSADKMLGSADKYQKVMLSKIKTITTEAQDILAPGIKDLRDQFGSASEAVKKLPDDFKIAKASIAEALKRKKISLSEAKQRLQALVSKSESTKKFLKKMGAGAATGLGLGAGGSAGYKLLQ